MPEDRSNPPAEPPKAATKGQVFARRLASTIVLWVVMVTAFMRAEPWMFFAMVAGSALLALVEYFKLFQDKGHRRFRRITYGVAVAYLVAVFAPLFGFEASWLKELDAGAIAALVILMVFNRLSRPLEGARTLDEMAVAVFGFVYIVILIGFLPKILMLPLADAAGADPGTGTGTGHFYVLYLLAVTKFTDMGAYAIGSLIGKHKMVPHVSPGKTWQGFGGAIFGACVASFSCLGLFGEKIPLITPLHATILAVVLALAAVLGDLAESILKRSLAAKDSGHGLPGIGGVLDLIDSVLFTGPILYFYLLVILS